MAIEVFNRHESKFLVEKTVYHKMLNELLNHMELDEYNRSHEFYTISNIYFDTEDNHLIRTSLSKPEYKEKLRLRAYGVPKNDEKVFMEIKKKVCGLVNKRRTKIKLNEAYDFINTGIKPEIKEYMNGQVLNEIHYILQLYKLEPKLYLAYDRKALFDKDDRSLRITFDTNIRTRRYDLMLDSGDYGDNLLPDGQWLMEVKAEGNIPLWVSKLLSKYGVYRASFSKYGREYRNFLLEDKSLKGEKSICLNHFSMQYQVQPQPAHQYRY